MSLPTEFSPKELELPTTVAESHALIVQLMERIAALEEKLKLNSRNSSKPPSSDGPGSGSSHRPKPKSDRKRGAQKGHPGAYRALLPAEQVDAVVDCALPVTCSCGGTIVAVDAKPYRHQVHEIPPIHAVVTEYRRTQGCCQDCGQHVIAPLPVGVPRGQLGPRAVALVGTLAGQYHLSQHKIHRILGQVFGVRFSVGTISAAHGKVAQALEAPCVAMKVAIQRAPVKHADETTHQSHGHGMWLWAMVSAWGAYMHIDASRSQSAARELLGETLHGVLVSDRYAGYRWVDVQQRQVCWAHLLRDFRRIAERPGEAGRVGRHLLALGWLLFRFREERREVQEYQRLQRRMRRVLERGAHQRSCSRTANTCRNLLELWPALWRFVDDPAVEPTNNRAERALRGAVLRRKISYVTRSGRGLRFVERIFSVVYTCMQQERDLYAYLFESMTAAFSGLEAPSLVPDFAVPA